MLDPLTFTARGFGPGLPPAGAEIRVRWSGDALHPEGWPAAGRSIRAAQLSWRRQGDGLLLEWEAPAGRCALTLDPKVGAGDTVTELLRRLPPARSGRQGSDVATRAWVWSLLSTHPSSSERSARLRQLMATAPAYAPLAADWAAVQASLDQTRGGGLSRRESRSGCGRRTGSSRAFPLQTRLHPSLHTTPAIFPA